MKRVLVIGASGVIGNRVSAKLEERLGQDIEFLLGQDRIGREPSFEDAEDKQWISANLDEVSSSWWLDILDLYNIDCIYYLETTENENMYLPTYEIIQRFRLQDATFIQAIRGRFTIPEVESIKILYLSTDKLYQNDAFPNELNPVLIVQADGNAEEASPVISYSSFKTSSETELLSMTNIDIRVIRPFAIAAPENGTDWPLSKIISMALNDEDLDVFLDGLRGLTFTSIHDLADFILHDNLFNSDINLITRIINMCRVRNYLPEEYLINKVISKTESDAIAIMNSDIDNYKYIMNTPQIRNSSLVWEPRVPIEMIIEELKYSLDPVNSYADLEVNLVEYSPDNYLTCGGTSEPYASISLFLGDGSTLDTVALVDGTWTVTSPSPIDYDDPMQGTAYATSTAGIQYMTILFDIPAAN